MHRRVFPFFCSRFIGHPEGPGDHSVLWNAMIYPFLNMTIKGAIWYQGEANSRKSNNYVMHTTGNIIMYVTVIIIIMIS